MESFKTWIVEVGIKKVAPSLIKTGMMALVAYISAHQGLLSSMGIDYDGKDNTIDISLNTISAWALVAIPAITTAMMTMGQHHAEAAITGTPQSGDVRQGNEPMVNGNRSTDPK